MIDSGVPTRDPINNQQISQSLFINPVPKVADPLASEQETAEEDAFQKAKWEPSNKGDERKPKRGF